MPLSERKVVIIGGSAGMGRAVAEASVELGAHVGHHRLDGAGCADQVAGDALGGRDRRRRPAEQGDEGIGLGAVVERRRGAVGVDVADVGGREPRIGDGLRHAVEGAEPVGVGGGEVVGIAGGAVAGNLTQRRRSPPGGVGGEVVRAIATRRALGERGLTGALGIVLLERTFGAAALLTNTS